MVSTKLKILIVEDEKDAVEYIKNFLQRRSFEIVSTGSGRMAVEILRKSRFDLVLLDLSLEDISGIEALAAIRKFDTDLKIIIITGTILMVEDRAAVCALGVHNFLVKPANFDQLLEAIEVALKSDHYLTLSDFPEWHYEPGRGANIVHDLKGILGMMNMQCSMLLSDVESVKDGDVIKENIVEQIKEMHEKIQKACRFINDDIV